MPSMAKEIERKFLICNEGWRGQAVRAIHIVQFYLASADDRSIRVRISDDTAATLTLKFGTGLSVRDEFEYPIGLDDARQMRAFTIGNAIDKTRHIVPWKGRDYEVDVFGAQFSGQALAELEGEIPVADEDLPPWLGREVTGDSRYQNASLARAGWPGAD